MLHANTKRVQNFGAPVGHANTNHWALECLTETRVDNLVLLNTEEVLRFANP